MSHRNKRSHGFSLIELLMVITIIGILSSLGLSIMSGAEQDALESRTRAGIERISIVLNDKLEANIYRILPVRIDPNTIDPMTGDRITPEQIADFKRHALAEIIRVEFPDQFEHTDTALFPRGAINIAGVTMVDTFASLPNIINRYDNRLNVPGRTLEFQDAECLYAILSISHDEHGSRLVSTLREREIGDTDGDTLKEVLDAFGDPLVFQIVDAAGDPLDPANPQDIQNYRVLIQSVNLKANTGKAVATQ